MKRKMCIKVFSTLCCVLLFTLMVSKTAFAAEESTIMPRAACSSCGGTLNRSIENVRTNTVVGSCKDDVNAKHYYAYRVSVNRCGRCGSIENESIIATGHYCDCDCEGTGGWCWD